MLMPGPTQMLAEYTAQMEYKSLPPEVVVAVKHMVLDSLGTALAAGTLGDGCKELVDMVVSCGGRQESTILGFGHKGPAPLVALANGGLVHALNYDAGGPGHLGVVALVAPLAASEYVGGVSGKEFVTAAAAACEVTARMSLAASAADQHGRDLPWLAGQVLGYVGAAAGAGKVFGLTPLEMQSAFGLAAMQAAGTRQVVLDGDPPAKAIYGAFPNQGGVQSALLSKFGLRADCAALEGEGGFYAAFFGDKSVAAQITDGLGSRYLLSDVRYKPWPTSGIVAPFIEAALELKEEHLLTPDRIDRVEFRGPPRIRHWCEPVEERRIPLNAANAANSIFFGIANALVHGEVTLEQFTSAGFADPSVREIARKTSFAISSDPTLTASITVWTVEGASIRATVDAASKPVTEAQLVAKFSDCARYAPRPIPQDMIPRLVDATLRLEDLPDVTTLVEGLSGTTTQ
jgi:2-methylcitrate dehydratase PrpD